MKSKICKRLFSLLIVVAMVLSMMPTFVFADGTEPEALNLDPDGNGCPHCEGAVEWLAWDATAAAAGGHYRLTANVSRTSAITIAATADTVIDLAGFSITAGAKANSGNYRVFYVNGKLSVIDSAAKEEEGTYVSGAITGGRISVGNTGVGPQGGNVYVAAGGTFSLYSGAVKDGIVIGTAQASHRYGGNIAAASGSEINMYGGLISGGTIKQSSYLNINDNRDHGGCNIGSFGDVNIYGGTIKDGSIDNWDNNYRRNEISGGNIAVHKGTGLDGAVNELYIANATITGGKLLNDRGHNYVSAITDDYVRGGNVFAYGVNVTITDSVISDGQAISQITCQGDGVLGRNAYAYGGNLYVYDGNLTISGNTTISNGLARAALIAYDDSTDDNSATAYAGNVYHYNGKLTISGNVKIENGVATKDPSTGTAASAEYGTYGGNMYLTSSTLDVKDLTVTGGTGYYRGGSAYLTACKGTLENTSFTGGQNTASSGRGGNIYINNCSSLTFTDCTISGGKNGGSGRGGNMCIAGDGDTITIDGGTYTASTDSGCEYGANIYTTDGSDNVKLVIGGGATLNGGKARYGGNIAAMYGWVEVNDALIQNGVATSAGGNLYVTGTTKASTLNINNGAVIKGGRTQITNNDKAEIVTNVTINTGATVDTLTVASQVSATIYDGVKINANPAAYMTGEATVLNGSTYTTYGTLKAALEAAKDGETVNLVKDADAAGAKVSATITLNLNEKALTGEIELVEGGALTAAEGLSVVENLDLKCLWYEEGTYALKNHNYNFNVETSEGTCSNCGNTVVCSEHVYGAYTPDGNATCLADGTKTAYCTICGSANTVADEGSMKNHEYDENNICVNGCEKHYCDYNEHIAGEANQEDLVNATCKAAGSYNMVVRCTKCNEILSTEAHTIDKLEHEYDQETGICGNGCNALAGAKVTKTDGSVVYYTDVADALVTENNTGATILVLKTATVTLKNYFNEYSLRNVTLATAEGVTLKDNSGASGGVYYFNGVTFAKDSKFELNGYPKFTGTGVSHIYGYVDLYMTDIGGDLVVHGDEGGYLRFERNCWIGADVHVIGNGPDHLVVEANYHSGDYNIYASGGTLTVENAKIVCDDFEWLREKAETTVATLTNATIECARLFVGEKCSINMLGGTTFTVAGASSFSGNGYVTMTATDVINATDADLQNTKILAAEGFDGCVYYADGAYTVAAHTYADAWTEGEKACTNNCGAKQTCDHAEYDLEGAEDADCTKPGYTGDKVCKICGHTFETGTAIDQLKHDYKSEVTDPTCTEKGYTTYTCACGDTYKDNYVDELKHIDEDGDHYCDRANCGAKVSEHSYSTSVTDPTCTEKGYTTYTCACGDSYVANYTDALDHAYPEKWTDNGENHVKVCTRCSAETITEAHKHDSAYTDPTTEKDGYWTYTCECGNSYVVIDENTRVHVAIPEVKPEDIQDKIELEEGTELTDEEVQDVIDNVVHGNDAVKDKDVFVDDANKAVIEQMKAENPELAEKEPVLNIALQGISIKTENGNYVAHRLVFDVTPMLGDKKIENLAAPLTFHLPVDNNANGVAYVYHDGEFMGIYEIVIEDGCKYVIVSTADFSEFAVETDHKHANTYTSNNDKKTHTVNCQNCDYVEVADCADADGDKFCDLCGQKLIDPKFTVDGVEVETLDEALALAVSGSVIKLLDNVVLTERLTLDKELEINLGGYSITGDFTDAFGMIYVKKGATVTFKNGLIENTADVAIAAYGYVIVAIDATVNGNGAGIYNMYYTGDYYGGSRISGTVNAIWNSGELVVSEYGVVEYLDNSGYAVIYGTVAEIYAQDGSDAPDVYNGNKLIISDVANVGAVEIPEDYKLVEVEPHVYKVVACEYTISVNGTKYESFAEGWAAITEGAVVTLMADLDLSEILTINKAITLDGAGYTLTSTAARAINIETTGAVTIKNLTIKAGERAINIINEASTVELNNVTATANNNAVMIATSAGAVKLTINNSDLTGLAVVNVAGAGAEIAIINTNITNVDATAAENYGAITVWTSAENAKVTVTGGTITAADDSKAAYIFPANATIEGVEDVGYIVALVGDAGFETLEEAVEKANGSTIELVRNVVLTKRLTIAATVTIDLNGCTITGAFEDAFGMIYVKKGATLTVKGGLIENTADVAIGNYGAVIVATDATVNGVGAGIYNFYYAADYYGVARINGTVNAIWNCGELVISEYGVVEYLDNSGYATIYGTVAEIYAQDGSDAPGVYNGGLLIIADASNVEVPEDYKLVEVEENVYKVVAKVYVAEANGTKYESFAEALAQGGEVKLLADIVLTERLTIASDLTIDLNGYSITGAFEDAFGLIYVKKGATLTVKGGLIENTADVAIGNYGKVIIEATATVNGVYAGLYNFYYQADYYGEAVVNGKVNEILNCGKLEIAAGAEVDYLDNSGYAVVNGAVAEIYAQNGADAEGVENAGVLAIADISNVSVDEGYKLAQVTAGNYIVIPASVMAYNPTTGEEFETVQAALNAAAKGETVKLLADVTEAMVIVSTGKTLDLNGYTLTSEMVVASFAGSNIVDSSNQKGLLVVADPDYLSLNSENKQLPVWTAEGIRFVKVSINEWENRTDANEIKYRFYFNMAASETILDEILANGTEGTGIVIRVKATWTSESGTKMIQYFEFSSEDVKNYAANWDRLEFRLTLRGAEGLTDLDLSAEIISAVGSTTVVYDDINNSTFVA